MLRYCLLIIGTLFSTLVRAQATQEDSIVVDEVAESDYYIQFKGDSVVHSSIALQEVYLFGTLAFTNRKEKLRYYTLKRKTLKVYPYAKLAAEHLVALNDSLAHISKKRHQRRYTKKVQQYIEEEFSAQLKKLTRTEGQILVKLIYRQTGKTAFNLVKELRSGWRAFWYNTTASVFDISIKATFNPHQVHEDYLIEDILQRAFAAGQLERQPSVLDYDYAQLSNQWKNKAIQKN